MARRSYYTPPRRRTDYKVMAQIEAAFDRDALARICEMHEDEFAERYDMTVYKVTGTGVLTGDDWYAFRDNGSDVLAVAHLDTVARHATRTCTFADTEGGTVVFSRALDDRLGAYIILDLLPKLGITTDVLLTVGEESGRSTAAYFEAPRQYDWMIEFDRGGTDVVLYQYEDAEMADLVRDSGAVVGEGIFSDISVLDHLNCKGMNWGVGYEEYHYDRAHAFLDDTWMMLEKYLWFHEQNEGTLFPHVTTSTDRWGSDLYSEEHATDCLGTPYVLMGGADDVDPEDYEDVDLPDADDDSGDWPGRSWHSIPVSRAEAWTD